MYISGILNAANLTTISRKNVSKGDLKPAYKVKLNTLTFKGKRNQKQVAIVSTSAYPLTTDNKTSKIIGALPVELNKLGLDTRMFLPIIDPDKNLSRKGNGSYLYNINDRALSLKDTGIEADYEFGAKKGRAKLLKANDENLPYKAYFVLRDDLCSKNDEIANNSAFCSAAAELIKKTENTKENFNPKFLTTNGANTAYLYTAKGARPDFDDPDEMEKIHFIYDTSANRTALLPVVAAASVLDSNMVDKIINDEEFKAQTAVIASKIKSTTGRLEKLSLNDDIENGAYANALIKMADNRDDIAKIAPENFAAINGIIIDNLGEHQSKNGIYFPTKTAIENSDGIIAEHENYLDALRQNESKSGAFQDSIKRAEFKSTAICDNGSSPSSAAIQFKHKVLDNPLLQTDIINLYSLDGKVYRGSQPGRRKGGPHDFITSQKTLERDMEYLKSQGFTTIIDLRTNRIENSDPIREKTAAEKIGMDYVNIRMDAAFFPTQKQISTFLDTVDGAKGKVLFHCRHGQDRTGIMTAVYLASHYEKTANEAIDEAFSAHGFPELFYMNEKRKARLMEILDNLYQENKVKKPLVIKVNNHNINKAS